MRAFILFGLLCASALCEAQSAAADSTFRILTYGLPRFEYQNATWVVGQKWGIEHRSVAGCVVTHELMDSVKNENDRVVAAIVSRFGADWNERFDAEVELEYQREKLVLQKIQELPYIQVRQKEMTAEGNGLHYWVIPGPNGDEVMVQGYAPWEGGTEWLTLYVFKADGKGGMPILLSDTPRKD